MRIKALHPVNGEHYGHKFKCPGCDEFHTITTLPYPGGWTWNGSDDRPTFTPSVLVHPRKKFADDGSVVESPRCHSFVAEGRIQYLADSTHALAGQTVDLPEITP